MGKPNQLLILFLILAVGGIGLVQEQAQEEEEVGQATITTSGTNDLGEFIADGESMTLYGFTQDREGVSFCYYRCAEDFPPLLTEGEPQAGEGVDGSLLGTLERADGSVQVTYNGRPLYRHWEDEIPNDTFGQRQQAYRGTWYVISPEGDFKGAEQEAGESEAEAGDDEGESILASGEEIFASNCQVCHGNTAPAMEGNEDLANSRYVITTILNGAAGGAMPAWADVLDNQQVASVASYIRTVGSNDFGTVSVEEVAEVRGH